MCLQTQKEVKEMGENKSAEQKSPDELLHESTKGLPDAEKLILTGVARGLALSGILPKTG